jgi:cytochrome c553
MTHQSSTVLAVMMTLVLGCGASTSSRPEIETGPGAFVTPDGLHRIDNVPKGVLFSRPDYAFGSYDQFALGEPVITLTRDSKVLRSGELDRIRETFRRVAREAMIELGGIEVAERGPCVAYVHLALVDLNLVDLGRDANSSTMIVNSYGTVTLILELRDGDTGEPLLRYGRRQQLGGGFAVGPTPGIGNPLKEALDRFASDFQTDFMRSRHRLIPVARAMTCAERAGLADYTPEVDARREVEMALALAPDLESGRRIYGVCAGCHEPEGWGRSDGTVPQLAGQHRSVIIKQLADIRAGNRGNLTMYAFASEERIGGPQAVADVAAYVDTLESTSDTGKGPGDDLELGASLYARDCSRCHGEAGEGDAAQYVPRIQSQHYAYLVRQFRWIRDGRRRNANPEMTAQIQGYSRAEMNAVLDYVSRLATSPSARPSSAGVSE